MDNKEFKPLVSQFKIDNCDCYNLINTVVEYCNMKLDDIIAEHMFRVLQNKCNYEGQCNPQDMADFMNQNGIETEVLYPKSFTDCKEYELRRGEETLSKFILLVSSTKELRDHSFSCKITLEELM